MQSHTRRLARLSLVALATATALLLSSAAAIADGGGGHGGGGHAGGHAHGGHGHHGGGHRGHRGAHPGVVHLGRAVHDHHDRLNHRPHDLHLGVRHNIHHPTAFFGFGHGLHRGGYYWDECDPYSLHYSPSRCRWFGLYGYNSYYWGGYAYGWSASSRWGSAYGSALGAASLRGAAPPTPLATYPPLDSPSGAAAAQDAAMRVPLLPSSAPPEALPPRDETTTGIDIHPERSIKDETLSEE